MTLNTAHQLAAMTGWQGFCTPVLSLCSSFMHDLFIPDIDECTSGTHNCSQQCHNTPGSYECRCDRYFGLDRDGQTCLGLLQLTASKLNIDYCQLLSLCSKE